MKKKLVVGFALATTLGLNAQQTENVQTSSDTTKIETVSDTVAVVQPLDSAKKGMSFFKTKEHDGRFAFKFGTQGAYFHADRFGPADKKIKVQSVSFGYLSVGVSGNDIRAINLLPLGDVSEANKFASATGVIGASAQVGTENAHAGPIAGYSFGRGFVYGAVGGGKIADLDVTGSVLFGAQEPQSEISYPFQYTLQGTMLSPFSFKSQGVPASVHKINQLSMGVRSYVSERDEKLPVPAGVDLDLSKHFSTRYTRVFAEQESTVRHIGSPEKGAGVSVIVGAYYQRKNEIMSFMDAHSDPVKTATFGVEVGAMLDFQRSAEKGGGSAKYRLGAVIGSVNKNAYLQAQLRRNLHVKR